MKEAKSTVDRQRCHYSEHMRRKTGNHICHALCYHGRERFAGFRQQTNIRR